ncbi:hypothetical protein HII31_03373 [Pseudocercospora fuligena]|uniref:Uncharacterized protein n=1 Tax=Pseudocercospora fuligena TaxID=685502 RepID=A0A8H6RQ50_9PEZI|nr:hypothetical protein HII31_03373 [Pseudocercospora fuligena]
MPSFFSLPAELREAIYFHLLVSHGPVQLSSGLTASTSSSVLPKLLLISRQLTSEYLSLAHKNSHLLINDDPMGSYISPGLKKPYLPPNFRHAIGQITINLTCLGFNPGDEVLFHEGWVEKVLDQIDGDPDEVRINVHLYSIQDILEYEAAMMWSGKWIRDERVKELKVYRTNIRDLKGAFEDGVREEIMSWNAQERRFVRCDEGMNEREAKEGMGNVWLNTAARIEVDALW